jgi:hypothetical protein
MGVFNLRCEFKEKCSLRFLRHERRSQGISREGDIMNLHAKHYDDVLEAAQKIYAATMISGGGTFTLDGNLVHRTSGYAVGGIMDTVKFHEEDNTDIAFDRIASLIQRAPSINRNRPFIGSWLHEGIVYLDLVHIVDSQITAIVMAHEHGQRAIYDFRNDKEIFVRETS